MNCSYCKSIITGSGKKYCSKQCELDYNWSEVKARLLLTGDPGNTDFSGAKTRAKRFLLETYGHQCQTCKLTEWMGKPIPLTLDHINGKSEDCHLTNLRMVCANCDRQSEFFGSKNRGNGRAWRRQRYQDGKSY